MDLYQILEKGLFPSDEIAFVKALLNPSEANLLAQESEILDYKKDFPESFSSDFGMSIIRLCIGFHNSYGGFICFGVDDKTRLPFCGRIVVDIEKLNKKIIEVCSREIRIKHLALPSVGVDILLCPKRPTNKSPVYLNRSVGKYSKNSCWRRVNQEVRLIEGRGAKLLLSARNHDERNQSGENEVANPYPASRSTIESFIGRTDYLIKLHEWLLKKRDKVAYLYGRGGSGKTKIAYEFGDIIRTFPNENPISSKSPATKVLFLSAKEKELRTADATIRDIVKAGFGTSDELFKRIVFESELADKHPMLFDYTSEKIEDLMFDALDSESFLIIIDDIDTLTTKNQESGLSVLNEAVSSASFPSKLLVTQRNRPIDALRNAIHVTGFIKENEFRAFLLKCCEKFETDPPNANEEARLFKISEGIPLIIETVSALARSMANWSESLNYYEAEGGAETRKYLHEREFNSIPKSSRGRQLLCALALMGKPMRFNEITFAINCSTDQLTSAIDLTSHMFINRVASSTDDEKLYSLTDTAALYISDIADTFPWHDKLNRRIKNLKSGKLPTLQGELLTSVERLRKAMIQKRPESVLDFIRIEQHPEIEDEPRYKSLKAQIYASLSTPNVETARHLFRDCLASGHLDTYGGIAWSKMEIDQKNYRRVTDEIAPYFLNSGRYDARTHAIFHSRSAFCYLSLAEEEQYMAPDEAVKFAFKAIQSNIETYLASLNCDDFDYNLSRHLGNAAKRAVVISIHGNSKSRYASFLRSLKQVSSKYKDFDFTSLSGALLHFKRHLIEAGKYSPKSAEVGFVNELSAMIKSRKLFISDKVMRDLLVK